jgi:DNA (cytosine-5)-methyltransferase 1
VTTRLLDLFCGGGGAGMGYHRAGFEVVGVDIEPIKVYPFEFHQTDALEYLAAHGHEFDAIHASPPCQAYTAMQHIRKNGHNHPDLVDPVRQLLIKTGKPYVIENVVGAPLRVDLLLCGSMFGLNIIRHRIFESNVPMPLLVPMCNHEKVYDPWHGGPGERTAQQFKDAMGIDWMRDAGGRNRKGTVAEAIPPAYTEFIGAQLMNAIQVAP